MASTAELLIRATSDVGRALQALGQVKKAVTQLNDVGTAAAPKAGGITPQAAVKQAGHMGHRMGVAGQRGLMATLGGMELMMAGMLLGPTLAAPSQALSSAIGAGIEFSGAMGTVKSLLNPAEVDRYSDALGALALVLGRDTVFTANEAAQGLAELIRAGVPVADILGGAGKAATELAAATGIPVSEAALIAAAAINTFGQDSSQITAVMDMLAGVANASAADMGDLRLGIQASGAVAAAVGMSYQDLALAIGVMANAGLRGQDAGTSLKTMLMRLTPDTKEATAMMQRLGLITASGANQFYDAAGRLKPLAEIAGVLNQALAPLNEQARLAALQEIFGTDAVRAAVILGTQGADGVQRLNQSLQGITVAGMAEARLDNLSGSLEQLKGSVETAGVVFTSILEPVLRRIIDTATGAVNAFVNLPTPLKVAAVTIAVLAAGAASLLGAFLILGPAIASLPGAFAALSAVWAGAVTAIGPAIAAVGAAVAGISLPVLAVIGAIAFLAGAWAFNWFGMREVINQVVGTIVDVMTLIATMVLAPALPLATLYIAWRRNFLGMQDVVQGFVATVQGLIAALIETIAPLGGLLSGIGQAVGGFVGEQAAGIGAAITDAVAGVRGLAGEIRGEVGAAAGDLTGALGLDNLLSDSALSGIGNSLEEQIQKALDGAKQAAAASTPQMGNLGMEALGLGNASDMAKARIDALRDAMDAARDRASVTRDELSRAREELRRFSEAPLIGETALQGQMDAVDGSIREIKARQAIKKLERISRRPARTDSQQLRRLELQREILGYQNDDYAAQHRAIQRIVDDQAEMTAAQKIGGAQAAKGQIAGLEAVLAKQEAEAKALETQVKQAEAAKRQADLAKKGLLPAPTTDWVDDLEGVGRAVALPPLAVSPGGIAIPGAAIPTTILAAPGMVPPVPTPALGGGPVTITITINDPRVGSVEDLESLRATVSEAVTSALGQVFGGPAPRNVAASRLPGAE